MKIKETNWKIKLFYDQNTTKTTHTYFILLQNFLKLFKIQFIIKTIKFQFYFMIYPQKLYLNSSTPKSSSNWTFKRLFISNIIAFAKLTTWKMSLTAPTNKNTDEKNSTSREMNLWGFKKIIRSNKIKEKNKKKKWKFKDLKRFYDVLIIYLFLSLYIWVLESLDGKIYNNKSWVNQIIFIAADWHNAKKIKTKFKMSI